MTVSRLLPIKQSTDLVTFTIKVNEQEIPRAYGVISILVTKEINRIPTAKIVFNDGNASLEDFEVSNQPEFVHGNSIEILAGYHSEEEVIFKGIIIKHSIKIRQNYTQLIVECKDLVVKTTIGLKKKYFIEKKDSDVFAEILSDYSEITPDIEDTTVEHKELVQYQITDWDFIVSRAEHNGQVCIVDDGILTIKKPTIDADPVASPLFGANILELDAEIDARNQVSSTIASAWNQADHAISEATASEPTWTENGDISNTDLSAVIGLETYNLLNGGTRPTDELQAWADAYLLRSRMAKTCGRVKFQGFSAVKPGTVLELAGVGNRMNGKVYVSAVRHEISSGNWVCDAQFGLKNEWHAEKFKLNSHSSGSLISAIEGLHVGIVSHLEGDPNDENRIQVKIPLINADEDGIWARIATLDAGNERGTFFLPEIDDEVIVGFIGNDPRNAVVLGMLHSSKNIPPFTASDENPEKGYVSKEKLKMIFNDEKKTMTFQTPDERQVILDDDKGAIVLKDKSGNSITLNSSGISIESAGELVIKAKKDIKIEGSMGVEIKATTKFKAEGSAGAELTTSAIAVLKGSLVQIN